MRATLARSGYPFLLAACLGAGRFALCALATFALATFALASDRPQPPLHRFHIPPQPLQQALLEFSRQSGLAVLASSQIDLTGESPPLSAELPAVEALQRLLQGSGLSYKQVDDQGLVILPAPAAEPGPHVPAAATAGARPTLEEVEVVASKRRTNLQRTPMTLTALGGELLQIRRIDSLFKLTEQVPSLEIARNGDHTASMLYLRGVGSDNYTEAGDPGLALHVDGIYNSRNQGSTAMLYDLDRVEVLRGPQGTLFGRNSTAGVINYHTARPEEEAFSRFGVTLGSHQRRALSGVVNLPVNDGWALRWAGVSDRADGTTRRAPGSAPAQRRYNDTDLFSHRLSSSWQLGDKLHWWSSYERFEDRGAGSLPVADHRTPVLIDTPGRTDLAQDNYRSRLEWDLGEGIGLTYIAGYSRMHRSQDWDGDRSGALGSETDPLDYHQSNRTRWAKHASRQHELQLKNDDEQPLRWLLAYFDFSERNGIRFDLEHQLSDGSGWGGAPAHSFQQPDRGSRMSAVYGQLDWDLSPLWQLSAGARSGRDQRYDRGGRNIGCPDLIRSERGGELGPLAVNRESAQEGQCFVSNYNDVSQSWHSTTHMARLSYKPRERVLLYLLYAEGFKPGIVEDGGSLAGVYSGEEDPEFRAALARLIARNNSGDPLVRAYVEPETSANLELGFKLGFLDGAMTANGALFNTHYRDMQVSAVSVDEEGFERVRSANAASATIRGLELELQWATGLSSQLSAFLSLLDARYNQFLGVDNVFPGHGQTWNPGAGDADRPDLVDFSGNRLKQAPRVSFGLNYSHSAPLHDLVRLTSRIGLRYSHKIYFDEANRGQRSGWLLDNRSGQWLEDPGGPAANIDLQPAYWRWDAGLKLEPWAGNWWLELYGENLTNELVRYDAQTPDAARPEFYLAPPRTLGVHLGLQFR